MRFLIWTHTQAQLEFQQPNKQKNITFAKNHMLWPRFPSAILKTWARNIPLSKAILLISKIMPTQLVGLLTAKIKQSININRYFLCFKWHLNSTVPAPTGAPNHEDLDRTCHGMGGKWRTETLGAQGAMA